MTMSLGVFMIISMACTCHSRPLKFERYESSQPLNEFGRLLMTLNPDSAWSPVATPLRFSQLSAHRKRAPMMVTAVDSTATADNVTAIKVGRNREKREVEAQPQIAPGSSLPDVDVKISGAEENGTAVSLSSAMGTGTTLLVGMPGAFTPTCTSKHLPSLISNWGRLEKLGINQVGVLTNNDVYVNQAWLEDVISRNNFSESESFMMMMSDSDSDAIKELGLVDDMGFGLGVRSKRFALVAEDGIVQTVAVDEGTEECSEASTVKVLETLEKRAREKKEEEARKKRAAMQGSSMQGMEEMDDETKAKVAIAGAVVLAAVLYFSQAGGGV